MQQQMSFLDMSFGKMSTELSVPTKERTSEKSLKKSSASKTVLPMFLDLRHKGGYASGNLVGQSWETDSLSLGAPSTHNFGECPKDVEESTLSQILEANVDPKYYLSATACRGVLRRAVNRGKIGSLPTLLKIALCLQGRLTADEINQMGIFKEGEVLELPFKNGAARFLDRNSAKSWGIGYAEEQSPTLREGMLPVVLAFNLLQDPISQDGITPCLSAGNSENGQAMLGICYIDYAAFNQGVNAKYDFGVDEKTAFTLICKPGAVCYAISTKQQSLCVSNDLANTLGADDYKEPMAVCFAIGNGQADQTGLHEKVGALNCMHDEQAVVFIGINGDKAGTLDGHYYLGCGARGGRERDFVACAVKEKRVIYVYVYVRRLTPTECARLQGMPDWWCADVPHADAPEYKMWGNGMALPNILYVMEGIAENLKEKQ